MKKFLIALAFAGICATTNAQETIDAPVTSKYSVATNSFWSNWYLQVGVDMNLQYNAGMASWFKEVFPKGKDYGVGVAVGKWFTPGIGTRLGVKWNNGLLENKHNEWSPDFGDKGYALIHFDTQFNLSNLLFGYNEHRTWNFIMYPRLGYIRTFDDQRYHHLIGAGIENTWRLSKVVRIYLDLSYNASSRYFADNKFPHIDENECSLSHKGFVNGELGLMFNLGKSTWDRAVTLEAYNALAAQSEAVLSKLRAELDKERALNAELRSKLEALSKAPKQEVKEVTKVISNAATNVFFKINSARITDNKDLLNLEAVANAAKKAGSKVLVSGYADSKTGSAEYNKQLSEKRANAVADKLVEFGINRNDITIVAEGGVDLVGKYPFQLNRRALVELK